MISVKDTELDNLILQKTCEHIKTRTKVDLHFTTCKCCDITNNDKIIIDYLQYCDKMEQLNLYFHLYKYSELTKLTIPKTVKNVEIHYIIYKGEELSNPLYLFPHGLHFNLNNSLETLKIYGDFPLNLKDEHITHIFGKLPISLKSITINYNDDYDFYEQYKNSLKETFNHYSLLPYGCSVNLVKII